MLWSVTCTKPDGSLRKQFRQFQIRKNVREDGLQDGDECLVTAILGDYPHTGICKLTSGCEFRLPREVAEQLKVLAQKDRSAVILFGAQRTLNCIERNFAKGVAESLTLSSAERRKRLAIAKAEKRPKEQWVQMRAFVRNADVVAEALYRANGICQCCESKAPFLRASDRSPYLEVHHRVRLADGGLDIVENALALCPNCHRKLHFGQK